MTAAAGRVWGWVRPALSYRPWGSKPAPDEEEEEMKGGGGRGWGWGGVTAWVWSWRRQTDPRQTTTQYWQTEEFIKATAEPKEPGVAETEADATAQGAPSWWRRALPSTFPFWWSRAVDSRGLQQRKCVGWTQGGWDSDREESDYETPPPSPPPTPPPPPQQASPFRFFARSWKGEILPEHFEICFNFLRHLFDLFVVGFLWTVSPPIRAVLEATGVQGAMKLWIHGMALFLVSTAGMGGLLWLVQEYLPQFALAYGIVQALVISVSVRQGVAPGEDGETEEKGGEAEGGEGKQLEDDEEEEGEEEEEREGEGESGQTLSENAKGKTAA